MLIRNNYDRLLASAKAEQILDKARIYLDISTLKIMMKARPTEEKTKYYLAAKDTGFFSTSYYSRDKITARIFTKPTHLNLITLSDKDIKQCITSRHEDGMIVELDYKAFEYKIMCALIGWHEYKDPHAHVAEFLDVSREHAKKINNAYFYGAGVIRIAQLVDDEEKYQSYLDLWVDFNGARDLFMEELVICYEKNGYVINPYGRFIYPSSSRNIFNNMVQSTGSDILIDALHSIDEFNLLFHRFDSLFFDFKKEDLYLKLQNLVDLMTQNKLDLEFNLNVDIKIGKNLNKLKKLK